MMKSTTYLIIGLCMLLCIPQANAISNYDEPTTPNAIQRVRINVTTPLGYTRHLLLGFTPDDAATDGFDYGYDAANIDDYSNDCNWLIEEGRYVIQGVGSFDYTKAYPLGLFLADIGDVEFSLQALENFDQNISVYIYDALNDTMHQINDASYIQAISDGDHLNRFYITFTDNVTLLNFANSQLSVATKELEDVQIRYVRSNQQLQLKLNNYFELKNFVIYDSLGKVVSRQRNLESDSSGVLSVDASNLTTGMYIIGISNDTGNINKRIIVSK